MNGALCSVAKYTIVGKRTIGMMSEYRRLWLSSDAMQIDGSCYCGYITYEATIDPDYVSIVTAPR
jgi:hypothetical protein